MPKRIERKIEREYERSGYSVKRSRGIAFATMNKLGLLRHHKGGKKSRKRGRR